ISTRRCFSVWESVNWGVIIVLSQSTFSFLNVVVLEVDVDDGISGRKFRQFRNPPILFTTIPKSKSSSMALTSTSLANLPLIAKGKVRDIYSVPSDPSSLL